MIRILNAILLLLVILLFGTLGFMWIDGADFLSSLYMTVITIAAVGYDEVIPLSPGGRIFTIFLIFIGIGFVLFLFREITEVVVEGGLRRTLGRMKMQKKVARLKDHFIVCGYGRIGKVICKILDENKRPFVVIEKSNHKIQSIIDSGYLVLEGEASTDQILKEAGIDNAKGLIAVVSSDADTVYITLSARGLRPDLFIMARSSGDDGAEQKLIRAGADKVFSPYFIGATRMAQQLVRPTVIDFIDLAVHGGELGLRLEEMVVSEKSAFVGQTLFDTGIRKNHNLIVVAIKRHHGEMIFNPNPRSEINASDTLVLLGAQTDIKDLEAEV
ncbi:MAG: NAD-binding protein [Proteobacteria bacterium]|nr:NAD-binding protein [Pseudomonadota bacterium]MBU1739573.1 NAD-binding protein [Pseudomonadota bacterium]